jgi:predicted nucleotidyltransferase
VLIPLDRDRIDAVVQAVADRLVGDWLLIGGALVSLWLEPRRVTEDVDLVGIAHTGADRLALLGLATELGLPVEALNSAADFFVYRIADWSEQIELFRQGHAGRIYRPSPTLLLLLKIGRLSDQDLGDCLALLKHVAANRLPIDRDRVKSALAVLSPTVDQVIFDRRLKLRRAIDELPP